MGRTMNPFVVHPHTLGLTYTKHARQAITYAATLATAAIAYLIHAIIPWLHTNTASKKIEILNKAMN